MIDRLDQVFRTRQSPYYIVTDGYSERSSGIRVTHALCHALNSCGYEAYLICLQSTAVTNPEMWTPLLSNAMACSHYLAGRKPIVVYPESLGDLDIGSGCPVRYLLAKPGLIQPERPTIGRGLVVAYAPSLAREVKADLILTVPLSDPTIFNPGVVSDGERQGRYFYFNRLLEKGGCLLPETAGAIEISPRAPKSLTELADIFRRAELLYCYEWSAIAIEARLCGCPVACMPHPELLPLFEDHGFGGEGLAWGTSEEAIAEAKATVGGYHSRYLGIFDVFRDQLTAFIERTQAEAEAMDFDACFPRELLELKAWPDRQDTRLLVLDNGINNAAAESLPSPSVGGLLRRLWGSAAKAG